ncbi:MAG: HEPN domain-containing protein [Niabella sp.]
MNNIEIKIDSLKRIWEDLIYDFPKNLYGLTLYSPHTLLNDIITEIEDNDFRNPANKKFFQSKLNYFFDNDPILKKHFKTAFKLLRSNFNSEKNNLILQACLHLKKQFEEGLYFNESLELLESIILSEDEITMQMISELSYLAETLITEYVQKGYILEDIKSFISNVFGTYDFVEMNGKQILRTKYPHKFKFGKPDFETYNSQVRQFIDGLTYKDRFLALSEYYYKEKERVRYVFIVEGLIGDMDIHIGNVNFYSISKKRYCNSEDPFQNEDLQEKEPTEKKFIQAAVEIDSLLPQSSLITAVNHLERALDLIACYFNTKAPLKIKLEEYLIIQGNEVIQRSHRQDKNHRNIKYNDSLNLSKHNRALDKVIEYNELLKRSPRKISTKLLNAIHWYSKAEASIKLEDKLLNYWIAIENLFNQPEFDISKDISDKKIGKLEIIQEIISSQQIIDFAYEYGWELYNEYEVRATFYSYLSAKTIEAAKLKVKEDGKIYLKDFITALPLIKAEEKDLLLVSRVEKLMNFYNDNAYRLGVLEAQTKEIKENILRIYRFRNLVVHNAHYDNTLLPYYVFKVRSYSGDLIRTLVYNCKKVESDLATSMINIYLRKERFFSGIKDNTLDVLTDKI